MSIDRHSLYRSGVLAFSLFVVLPLTPDTIFAKSSFVSPTALVFSNQAVGTVGATQTVTFINSKKSSLSISSIAIAGDFTQTNTCTSTLLSGKGCTVSIVFRPQAVGTRTGTLTFTYNGPGSGESVALHGTGTGTPVVALAPSGLNFGDQNVGTTGAPQSVSLANTGNAPLAVGGFSIAGDFAQTNTCGTPLAAGATCQIFVSFVPSAAGPRTGTLAVTDNAAGSPHKISLAGNGVQPSTPTTKISALWVNEGGDKVAQEELRASRHIENLTGKVINRAWDGSRISLFGAHNEVISFNLVLEAAGAAASNVSVIFDTLTGPNGSIIASKPASGSAVFDWVGRPIELFFVRYLPIKGLSFFGYEKGDERQVPVRFQTPWTGNGVGTGRWTDRPDHDKSYPDILVPFELVKTFNIASGRNQSIWADIYIPKTAPAGSYSGQILIQENGATTHTIPVQLSVANFSLPDSPTTKTMISLGTTDIEWRYITGYGGYANWASADGLTIQQITDKYYQLFHRHKLALIGENECPIVDAPCASSVPRLNGGLFTAAHGYDGPGVNSPNDVFSIGTYGTWGGASYGIAPWKYDPSLFQTHTNNWVSWFDANLPNTDYFIYLQDEPTSSDFGQVEMWSEWIKQNPGPGQRLRSMSTVDAVLAQTAIPSLDLPVTHAGLGNCPNGILPCDASAVMQNTANFYNSTPGRALWMYNDGRPGIGSADTEDDGIAMRTIPWAQYKKGVQRWFYWSANINGTANLFQNPVTWGSATYIDPSLGQYGYDGTTNGDGVLVYPGTDVGNLSDSYGVQGPFASLRLKEWRRGIQDSDYLALANQIDPASTQAVLNAVMPQALWDYKSSDPTWYSGSISWSSDPDSWETGRIRLGQIISTHCTNNPDANVCQAH